ERPAMTDASAAFTGSVPELYTRYAGPVFFAPYAADLAGRIKGMTSGALLETACGTGILTRALAAALPGAVAITATDLNPPMIDFAKLQPGAEGKGLPRGIAGAETRRAIFLQCLGPRRDY